MSSTFSVNLQGCKKECAIQEELKNESIKIINSSKKKEEKEIDKKEEEKEIDKKRMQEDLQKILLLSKINHTTEIMKCGDLKEAHIYCKINNLSGQISGPLLEKFMIKKFNMIKNKSSE